MKKTISLILALLMCLALIPMTAMAYGNEWIELEKDNFDPNEEMPITFFGITTQMIADSPHFYIVRRGVRVHDGSDYIQWGRPYDQETRQGGTFTTPVGYVKAPVENGEYEILLYRSWHYVDEDIIAALPFTVGPVANQGSITLDKTAYVVFEPIIVSVSGITEQMVTSKAFVGVYERGEEHRSTGNWAYLPAGSSRQTLTVPNRNGEFEVRLYSV